MTTRRLPLVFLVLGIVALAVWLTRAWDREPGDVPAEEHAEGGATPAADSATPDPDGSPIAEDAAADEGASASAAPAENVLEQASGGLSGTLVFQSDRAGRDAIFTIDLASRRVTQLSGGQSWTEGNPRWSPDGSRIVFRSNRAHYEGDSPETGTPDFDLWIVDADGTGRRRLTTDPANETDPSWAPDGRSIVYSADADSRGDLYRVWLDGGKVERLTRHYVGRAIMPTVSPDGGRVAFAAQTLRVGQFWDFQVHLLDVASGRTEPVPAEAGACWPAWSRDGSHLAHVLLVPNRPSTLGARDMKTGQQQTLVRDGKLWSYYPNYSPDDRFVAFAVSPEHHEGQDWDLAVLDVSSGKYVRVTEGRGNDRLPDWRP